jgi:diguanylate cyclase (GGDEF)-like protein
MALVTEEIIVSKISEGELRHIRCQHEMTPHGHIIVPLKAIGRVVGVLSLYIEYDVDVTEGLRKLLLSIGSSIGIAVNNARLYEETKSFSLHDPLTGLANRRFMDIQMDKGLDAAERYEEEFSVIMADIDHFKRYNDEHGHQEGDNLLKKVADILSLEVRRADCVFRYGGEEFLIILPKTGPATAFEAAERLRKAVQQEAGVTISLGIASLTPTDQRKEDLIDHADKALYRAKEGGRNRVESASTAKA